MNYRDLARSILSSLSFTESFYAAELEPIQRRQQSDDERIAEIAWERMKLMQRERTSGGSTMMFI